MVLLKTFKGSYGLSCIWIPKVSLKNLLNRVPKKPHKKGSFRNSIPCVSKKTIHFWNGGQIKNIRFWGEKIICMDSLWTQLSYDTKPLKIIHAWMSTAHSCKGYGN